MCRASRLYNFYFLNNFNQNYYYEKAKKYNIMWFKSNLHYIYIQNKSTSQAHVKRDIPGARGKCIGSRLRVCVCLCLPSSPF